MFKRSEFITSVATTHLHERGVFQAYESQSYIGLQLARVAGLRVLADGDISARQSRAPHALGGDAHVALCALLREAEVSRRGCPCDDGTRLVVSTTVPESTLKFQL